MISLRPFMRRIRVFVSVPLLCLLLLPLAPVHAQQRATRPRVVPTSSDTPAPKPSSSKEKASQPTAPTKSRSPEPSTQHPAPSTRPAEPTIRIGIATNADFANITCDGPMARLDLETKETEEIASGKVTVQLNAGESRKRRGGNYRVQVASLKTNRDAEELAQKLRKRFDEPVKTHFDRETESYVVSVGEYASSSDAQTMMVRVSNAGYRQPSVAREGVSIPSTKSDGRWRLSATAANGDDIASGVDRVAFIALEPDHSPLKYLNSTYRGRLEVFLNKRGRMTVVNILPMEDYVRGVVPNELSPNAFPQLEALKAQAVAARTYAVKNKGNYGAEGFDLLPTAMSQVYGGRSSEHPLTDRAVLETRGMVATYNGEPINALYTSTSGGRTESVEHVYGRAVPYLKSVTVAPRRSVRLNDRWIATTRKFAATTLAGSASLARELAVLSVIGFPFSDKDDEYDLERPCSERECNNWAFTLSQLAQVKRPDGLVSKSNTLGGFARTVLGAIYGNESPARLMTVEDANYLLGSDAASVPEPFRVDVAFLLREGILKLTPGNPFKGSFSRATAIGIMARALLGRSLPKLISGTARPFDGQLAIRGAKGKDDPRYPIAANAYLFRKVGGDLVPVERAQIIGGEAVAFHLDARGKIDYLEISPVLNGATSDRFSQFSWWDERLTPGELRARLARVNLNVGDVIDIEPVSRGESERVAQLKIVGTQRTATVDGIRIRSALGIRESLFVVIRERDEKGTITTFRLRGRGWGHGVGLCQVGAYGLALEGYTYEQILKHFYTGIQLTRMY
jgi:stage II sporulation protein D